MNIDLLFTQDGEAGLLSSTNLVKKAAGIVIDVTSGLLTIEYADMDFLELNIPVEEEFFATLDMCPQIHIGAVMDDKIAQAYQVPFMFMDDPYRMEAFKNMPPPRNPLQAFDYFVKSCVFGQPVHREDLADEDKMGCILGDAAASSLQFAPQLARRQALEAAPRAAPSGPAGPGLGGGGGGRAGIIRTQDRSGGNSNTVPPKKTDSDD
jgi:hypothetical protein